MIRILASMAALAAFASAAAAQAPVQIRVGHGAAGEEQLWLMKAKPDITPNQGKAYTLDFTGFRGTDQRFQAYEAGALDAATSSGNTVLFASSQGLKFKALASLSYEAAKGFVTQYYVRDDGSVNSIQDLKDKTVGINAFKSSIELWARIALAKGGLNPDRDVKIAPIPFPAQGEALRSKKIDVGAFPQPFAGMEAKKGGVKTLFTSKTAVPFDEVLMTVLFREEFMQKNPEAVRAFMADLVAATKWYLADTKAAKQALIDSKLVQIPAEIYLDIQDSYRDPDCRVDIEAMNKMQDMQVELGFQKDKVDVAKVVDMSWLPK